ncbi:MAG: GntR family transcriptional regulator [Phycisphaerae bacterium]|nr:GntR family transcriptional regulator [Phycisphaerae bacterium]
MVNKRTQLRSAILSALGRGDFKVGDKLPTEAELIRRYGISRATVREGLASLVEDGILARRRGDGTYVASLSPDRRSKMLAAMIPCVRGEWNVYDQILRAAEDVFHERGYSLVLCNHDNEPEKVKRYIGRLLQDNVAGVLYAPMMLEDQREENLAVVDEFERIGMPFVLVDSAISVETVSRFTTVATNGFAATREVVTHLVSLGHRRIGYVRGFPTVYSSDQRYLGYLEEMRRRGLELAEGYVQQIQYGPVAGQGQAELRAMLACDPPPTAVICIHDFVAKNVMDEARRLGLRAPQDLAVVGFDDLPFVAHLEPPLTSVRQPTEREGHLAARFLLEKIEAKTNGERQEFLTCELMVRGSCGGAIKTADRSAGTFARALVK